MSALSRINSRTGTIAPKRGRLDGSPAQHCSISSQHSSSKLARRSGQTNLCGHWSRAVLYCETAQRQTAFWYVQHKYTRIKSQMRRCLHCCHTAQTIIQEPYEQESQQHFHSSWPR
ncbi:GSCOCG00007501001-RA-CDS [Cotesia congregata]|nr:GSCOCG00007501001-RA-CDS [Cotesia congregata]